MKIENNKLVNFCKRYHIKKLSIFGSMIHNNVRQDSDIDILVEFEYDHVYGLFTLIEMEIELTAIFNRKADLHTPNDLSRHFRDEVLKEAEVQYEVR
jgi:predicted nucleotidyltransferase